MQHLNRSFAACLIGLTASMLPWPSVSAESNARLGTNLTEVNDYSSQVPFIDAFKQSREWYTQRDGVFDTEEAARLQLDTNGWLRTLAPTAGAAVQYTRVCTLVFSMGEVVGGLNAGDPTQKAKILEDISEVFSKLNRARATVDRAF